MKNVPTAIDFSVTLDALLNDPAAKSAIFYLSPKQVIKFTWHNKPKANNRSEHVVMNFGAPNYRERAHIAKVLKDNGKGTPFKAHIELRPWPKKKTAAKKAR